MVLYAGRTPDSNSNFLLLPLAAVDSSSVSSLVLVPFAGQLSQHVCLLIIFAARLINFLQYDISVTCIK